MGKMEKNEKIHRDIGETAGTANDMDIGSQDCLLDDVDIGSQDCLSDDADAGSKDCLADDVDIGSKDCLSDDMDIGSKDCLSDDADAGSESCLANNMNISSESCPADNVDIGSKSRLVDDADADKKSGAADSMDMDRSADIEEKIRRHQLIRRLIIVTKLQKRIIEREVNQTGVYRSQHQILMYVAEHPNVSQKDIAFLHHASPATIAVSLKKLEKGGYLVRRTAENDNRVNQILLTEKGKTTVERSKQMFQKIEKQMLDGISKEEMRQTEAVLKHLFDNCIKILPETEKEEMNW